jgi:hypothetical protein
MASQCESCLKWGYTFTRHYGGHFGREESRCFDCLSVHDQEQVEAGQSGEGGK